MLEDVIAERQLEFRASDGSVHLHDVRLSRPARADVDWRCEYEISGPLANKRFYQVGVDAMQALTLALTIIPDELQALERALGGSFVWLGNAQLGFPTRPDW